MTSGAFGATGADFLHLKARAGPLPSGWPSETFSTAMKRGSPSDSDVIEEVSEGEAEVFRHVFRAYLTLPSPYYGKAA